MIESRGTVYILGAGPGHLAYLTVGGQQLLTAANVIIYDALINPQLLTLASPQCLRLPVGKRGGQPSTPQSNINQLLIQYCQQGCRVVRLKSGDPFVFGRTISELRALTAAGCAVEVWPGLSSALAAPLLAGIPLTDPECSRSFTVVSAHQPATLNWSSLAQLDTLVILMGGEQLAEIVHRLQGQGKPVQTPMAIIRWGGWDQQRVWWGTLADMVAQTQGERLSPSVIVVGEVVQVSQTESIGACRPSLPVELSQVPSSLLAEMNRVPTSSADAPASPPLGGKTILVTRSASQSQTFVQQLQGAGATVMDMPALEILPPSTWHPLDQAIDQIDQIDWLILTSANGVHHFFERLLHQGKDGRSLASLKIAVVGRKTAASLQKRGLVPDLIPPDFVADALLENFPGSETMDGMRILFPRVETGGREVLVAQLKAKGATVVEVPAYQSRCPQSVSPQIVAALRAGQVNAITFASSKTVRHFCQLLQQASATHPDRSFGNWQAGLDATCIASIGPQTSQTCRELLGRVDLEANEYTLEGLTQSLIDHYAN